MPGGIGPITAWPSCQVIEAVCIEVILLKVAICVVDAYGPEPFHRDIFHRKFVFANRQVRLHIDVLRGLVRQAAPGGSGAHHKMNRVDLGFGAEYRAELEMSR